MGPWRKRWDSNPRYLSVRRFSRPFHSTGLWHASNFGANDRARTRDLTIIGRLLYQLSYTRTHLTVYRVTGKLTTRAGFVSDSLARGLLPLPHSLGLVSDYNSSTYFLQSRISQVSCLTMPSSRLFLPLGKP